MNVVVHIRTLHTCSAIVECSGMPRAYTAFYACNCCCSTMMRAETVCPQHSIARSTIPHTLHHTAARAHIASAVTICTKANSSETNIILRRTKRKDDINYHTYITINNKEEINRKEKKMIKRDKRCSYTVCTRE